MKNNKKVIDNIQIKINTTNFEKEIMLEYTYLKISEEDYHGAIDALMDLREMIEEVKVLNEMIELLRGK